MEGTKPDARRSRLELIADMSRRASPGPQEGVTPNSQSAVGAFTRPHRFTMLRSSSFEGCSLHEAVHKSVHLDEDREATSHSHEASLDYMRGERHYGDA